MSKDWAMPCKDSDGCEEAVGAVDCDGCDEGS